MDAQKVVYTKLAERTAGESWDAIEIQWSFSNGSTRKLTRCEFYVKSTKDNTLYIETLKSDGTSPGITIVDDSLIKVIIASHTPVLPNQTHTFKATLKGWYDDGLVKTYHYFDIPVLKSL